MKRLFINLINTYIGFLLVLVYFADLSRIFRVTHIVKNGDSVNFIGFGKFSVGDRAARTGRNPKTGELLKIKASKAPKFTAGKGLKDAVSGKK